MESKELTPLLLVGMGLELANLMPFVRVSMSPHDFGGDTRTSLSIPLLLRLHLHFSVCPWPHDSQLEHGNFEAPLAVVLLLQLESLAGKIKHALQLLFTHLPGAI